MSATTTPSPTAPSWTVHPVGTRVRILITRSVGHVEGNRWVTTGEVTAGRIGYVTGVTNAGFRGQEHAVRFGRGATAVRVHGLSANALRRLAPR